MDTGQGMSGIEDFQRARLRADLEQVLAHLTGKPIDLLEYDEVRKKLHAEPTGRRVLKDIPLDAIVGTVDRGADFTRSFLPRRQEDIERWTRIHRQMLDLEGLPPIEAYQIGDAYFVLDGHHRVSVARHLGATHIEAHVEELSTKIPLTPGADPTEVVLWARYLAFLERTGLDRLRPGASILATWPEAYDLLERHIELHRRMMELSNRRSVAYPDAATDWYDQVYLPLTQVIREQNALRDFGARSETDLYLYVSGYRALTEDVLDWEFDEPAAGTDESGEPALKRLVGRILRRARSEPSVLPGEWRRAQVLGRSQMLANDSFRLFTSVLVPVSGRASSWTALEQALDIARLERGRILGLHVAPDEPARHSSAVKGLTAEFDRHCAEAAVLGKLALATGDVAATICERSRWVDLTALGLSYPPPGRAWGRFQSGLRMLIGSCRSPLLLVPAHGKRALEQVVLAYNGSAHAGRALFVAAYMALRWAIRLTVVSVAEMGFDPQAALREAEAYLETQGITGAEYLEASGGAAPAILDVVRRAGSGLLILGGYSRQAPMEVLRGSVVDEILRAAGLPVLILSQDLGRS